MAQEEEAEIHLTPEQVISLIAHQFPELPVAHAELLGTGSDNDAFLIDSQFVFRFPYRASVVPLIERESRILPLLAPRLPLAIPAPQFLGKPSESYPFPFAGHARIPGVTACQLTWSEAERTSLAVPLAQFLYALHNIPVEEEALTLIASDPVETAEDLVLNRKNLLQSFAAIAASLSGIDAASFTTLVEELPLAPKPEKALCWAHGDLYPRHLLVGDDHSLQGVIDWGDIRLGDSAIDLMIAFLFLPPPAQVLFRATYGEIDEADWARAHLRALNYGVSLISYGIKTGDTALRAIGEYALRVGCSIP